MDCKAYQQPTGEWCCPRCGYQWDEHETPPACKTGRERVRELIEELDQ